MRQRRDIEIRHRAVGLRIEIDLVQRALQLHLAQSVETDRVATALRQASEGKNLPADIQVLFDELLKGHMWDENELREVLGHTPLQVAMGALLGVVTSVAYHRYCC